VRRLLTASVVGVCVLGLASAADATPGSGVSAVLLAQGTSQDAVRVRTHGATDTVVRQITVQPGGTTGWHYHDGQLLAVVASGTVSHYNRHCRRTNHSQGSSFQEGTGPREVHMGANEGTTPLVLVVTYINPAGSPLSADAPAPRCAKGK